MELKEILAISKLPGLYKMVASRSNGLIVTPIGEDTKKFISSRQHMFTPLENITIYTQTDSIELVKVFEAIKNDMGKTTMPDNKAKDADFRSYFSTVVPEHDQEKVYINDIKKILKWYVALDKHGLLSFDKKEEKTENKKEKATKEVKPKTKDTAKAKNVNAPKAAAAKAQPTRQKK